MTSNELFRSNNNEWKMGCIVKWPEIEWIVATAACICIRMCAVVCLWSRFDSMLACVCNLNGDLTQMPKCLNLKCWKAIRNFNINVCFSLESIRWAYKCQKNARISFELYKMQLRRLESIAFSLRSIFSTMPFNLSLKIWCYFRILHQFSYSSKYGGTNEW